MNLTDYPVEFHPERHRFELTIDGHLSILEFRQLKNNALALTHTEVDPELEGKGVGSYLVKSAFEYIDQQHWTIFPYCPFVVTYLRRHPAWYRLVSPDFEEPEEF